MIYLDNAATTKIDERVLDAMLPYLTDKYGNAGTLYGVGREAASAVEKARQQVANLINASPEQIIFTSGGTEANNLVFAGTRNYLKNLGKTKVITSQIEHESVLRSVEALVSIDPGFNEVLLQPEKDGSVSPESVEKGLDDSVGIVSVMHMNNETGVENDIVSIGQKCREYGVLFHTDCVQSSACSEIDVSKILCDFLSLSSHKLHGPKGIGALYARDKSILSPLIYGGYYQEFGYRGGTENVAGIVGFGEACEILKKDFETYRTHSEILCKQMYTNIRNGLQKMGLESILHINGTGVGSMVKTMNLRFDGVDGETLLLLLDSRGVCVSAGSACTSHESSPSHVLTSIGVDQEDARNSIRISVSRMNTAEEIEEASKIIVDSICFLLQQ